MIITEHDLFSPGRITCPITTLRHVAADVMGPQGVSNYILQKPLEISTDFEMEPYRKQQ